MKKNAQIVAQAMMNELKNLLFISKFFVLMGKFLCHMLNFCVFLLTPPPHDTIKPEEIIKT